MIGPSLRLMAELVQITPALGIRLAGTLLPDEEAARLAGLTEHTSPIWREVIVWFSLFEAARLSLAHGSAISFR
jgi:hypothetical protein